MGVNKMEEDNANIAAKETSHGIDSDGQIDPTNEGDDVEQENEENLPTLMMRVFLHPRVR